MCPPSSDPIRPLGPVAGGVYVGRAELPGRVKRRERRQDSSEQEPNHGDTWSGTDQQDTGAYDDHGRPEHGAADHPDTPRPHIDTTA
jgi:hypothetical protein